MTHPAFPEEIRQELDEFRRHAALAFGQQDWTLADRRFSQLYTFLIEKQNTFGRRFHKGWELHNHGYLLLNLRFSEGVNKIHLAYVEDALSADSGEEDSIDQLPAGSFVRNVADARVAEAIKRIVREQREKGESEPLEPDNILEVALKSVYGKVQPPELQIRIPPGPDPGSRKIEEITVPLSRRCFVGGNYFVGI